MKKLSFIAFVFLLACSTTKPVVTTPTNTLIVDGKLFTTAFQQRAAEYRALCYQAYNLAFLRLDEALLYRADRPLAIVTDVDETVLDNSAYAAKRGLQGLDYEPASWTSFINMAVSDTVPGALSFFQYAASNGVEVFYITNRTHEERAGTLTNLQKFGFPNADETHLLTKGASSGKESRRAQVARTHDIVLMIGDNLSDFSDLFDKRSQEERMMNTNAVSPEFGKRYIMLPNPVYGDWELALFNYSNKFTAAEKDSILKSWLKTY